MASCTARSGFELIPGRLPIGAQCEVNADCADVCINGVCAVRSVTGYICDEPDDCENTNDLCPSGICVLADVCGNGLPELGETCDDGQNGDGCRDDCTTGCICATGQGCAPTGEWCDAGTFETCDVHEHCGPACEDCTLQLLACRPDGTACEPVADCAGLADFTACDLVTSPSDRWYDICVSEVCVSPGCGNETCNTPGPNFNLADTNQRDCYDDAGVMPSFPGTAGDPTCGSTAYCGQDAQYGWDTQNPETARFARDEVTAPTEPVVTDNVTGLMWHGCSRGQSGSDCLTGAATTFNWSTALSDCDGPAWGGHTDWRLPDEFELQSIVDYGRVSPSIDPIAFPATPSHWFWSSSTSVVIPAGKWYVAFGGGMGGAVSTSGKASTDYVRCVRRGA